MNTLYWRFPVFCCFRFEFFLLRTATGYVAREANLFKTSGSDMIQLSIKNVNSTSPEK